MFVRVATVYSSFLLRQIIHHRSPPVLLQMSSRTYSADEIKFTDALAVQHNMKKKKFFIKFGDDEAVLDYNVIRPSVLDLYHTGVPVSLQGKGIAKRLAEEAFDYVVDKDYQMKISCSYLQKYLKEYPNPEYTKRVVSK